jgi:hypothetical protein
VDDLNVSNRQLGVRHRPDTGTHLKQGEQAERLLAIDDETSKLLRDYIEWNRIDAEDEHGRDPLFTTARGRASKTCLRRAIYSVTRPCEYTGECPHDRNIDDCKAAQARKYASECPSSLSPHPIRRGSITHHLNDAPQRAVSERMNVSLDVLEKHYDRRTEEEKMDKRKEYFTDQ